MTDTVAPKQAIQRPPGNKTLRTVDDYLAEARARISPPYFASMFGVEGDGIARTDAANRAAFAAVGLRPRVLRDVSSVSTATTLLGSHVELPIALAPVGNMISLHPDAELATVRAASTARIAMALSFAASASIDDVIAEAQGPLWCQVYVMRDRDATRTLVEHAESVGCHALVITVDNPGIVQRDLTPGNRPVYGTIEKLGLGHAMVGGGVALEAIDPALSWRDIDWIRSLTSLPIVIKGIQTAEDAKLAVEHGAAGVVVSNHGGQALPASKGTMSRLREVVEAADEIEVFLDGGVREGTDVLKALALGARAVLIGRAQYWGIAVGGTEGLLGVIEVLRRELSNAMKFCGVSDVSQVNSSLVD